MREVIGKIFLLLSIGAIFVAVSEFWFYPVSGETSSIGIVIAYGLLGYLFLLLLKKYRIHSFSGLFVTAALFGFLVEGIPVPVLYSGLPFTLVWTSLAWHALITVMLGWYWYRIILSSKKWVWITAYNASLGVGLGIWGAYMWNAVESVPAADLTFLWQSPMVYSLQFLFGWLLFTGGHVAYELIGKKSLSQFRSWEIFTLATVSTFCYAFQLILFFPFALIMVALVAVTIAALRQEKKAHITVSLLQAQQKNVIPLWAFAYSILIPIGAVSSYIIFYTYQIELEANALIIITAGPLAVWWWLQSQWKLLLSPKKKCCFKTLLEQGRSYL